MTHAAVRTRIATPRSSTPRMLSFGGRLEGAEDVPRGEGSSVAMGISLGTLQAAGKWMSLHKDYITSADRRRASGGSCSPVLAGRCPVARQGPSRLARLCR
jgi:hypothetical protein